MLHRTPGSHPGPIRAILVVIVVLPALAATMPSTAAPVADAPPVASAAAAPGAPQGPSLGQALQAVVDEGLRRVATLEAAAKDAAGGEQALAAQAAIIAAKEQMERDMLTVQLDYARRAGNAKLATQLEGVLARLDAPAVAVPQDRAAPPASSMAREVR